ncbi:MAG: hypothetical protein SNH63_04180 [Rikenellaceae bacterium]
MLCSIVNLRGEVTPRIEELAGDSTYMSLLALDAQYVLESDSLSREIAANRELFLAGGDQAFEAQSMIMTLEQAQFSLRNRRSVTTSQIETIEQDWISKNQSTNDALVEVDINGAAEDTQIYPTEIVGHISQSGIVGKTLSAVDLKSLVGADNDEHRASALYNRYVENYLRAAELQHLYNQTEIEEEALEYEVEFSALEMERDSLATDLEPLWEQIYDDKLFIYSLLLETLNNNELLESGLKSLRKAEVKVSTVKSLAANPAIVDYMHKKLAMVEFENQIAERFNLPRAADSLLDVAQKLMVQRSSDEMPQPTIKERNFIPYEPMVFSTNVIYSDSLPIPQTQYYTRGRVYRIQLGAYKAVQKPELFKGASPLSHEVIDGVNTYYGGSYATYVEAEQAQAESKAHGFNRPELVVWDNGERRNLFRDPLPANDGYNVVIEDVTNLSPESSSVVELLGAGATLIRISTNKYVISPLKNILIAEDLVAALEALNSEAVISIKEIEVQ